MSNTISHEIRSTARRSVTRVGAAVALAGALAVAGLAMGSGSASAKHPYTPPPICYKVKVVWHCFPPPILV